MSDVTSVESSVAGTQEWQETPDLFGAYPRLTEDQIATLRPGGTTRPVAVDEILIREGTRSDELFLILSGKVAIVTDDESGETRVLRVHGPGRFLGELGDLEGQPAFYTAIVVVEGEVTIVTESGEATLGPLDSIYLAPNEARAIENRTNKAATMLVVMPPVPKLVSSAPLAVTRATNHSSVLPVAPNSSVRPAASMPTTPPAPGRPGTGESRPWSANAGSGSPAAVSRVNDVVTDPPGGPTVSPTITPPSAVAPIPVKYCWGWPGSITTSWPSSLNVRSGFPAEVSLATAPLPTYVVWPARKIDPSAATCPTVA